MAQEFRDRRRRVMARTMGVLTLIAALSILTSAISEQWRSNQILKSRVEQLNNTASALGIRDDILVGDVLYAPQASQIVRTGARDRRSRILVLVVREDCVPCDEAIDAWTDHLRKEPSAIRGVRVIEIGRSSAKKSRSIAIAEIDVQHAIAHDEHIFSAHTGVLQVPFSAVVGSSGALRCAALGVPPVAFMRDCGEAGEGSFRYEIGRGRQPIRLSQP